ncbi:permease [Pilibacter termitis]|nr:permease [Pilibacter termitis]
MGTIFLSIIIEALPFVLLGCLVSGGLQVFLTAERVKKLLPKNKFLSILTGCILGFFFPSCECGIVPIVNRFVEKKVPEYTAFAFMLTAPIVNPVVIFSTYIAFGNTYRFALLRVIGSFLVAIAIGSWIAYFYKGSIRKIATHQHIHEHQHEDFHNLSFFKRVWQVLEHAIEEFFDTGRYLIFGSLAASVMQTYLPTKIIYTLGSNKLLAIPLLLFLAFVLSLCSEADAFIGSSLVSLFGTAPIVAFLVFGPMVDIKNILMMKRYFQPKFILQMMLGIFFITFIYALCL